MDRYEVELIKWDGHEDGSERLTDALNDWARDGWTVVSVVPVSAGASARSLLSASASAETQELAIVLKRSD